MRRPSGFTAGNRYDERMVPHDVSDRTPGTLLVARLHVDLCRLSSAMCTDHPSLPPGRTV
ncbi:hypothetical protein PZB75_09885 [Streptomyces sp. AM 4-1-1]|nr:putative leader peptide [Streptomyces sp. AM 4-1-1]WEH33656.1 hypothetical protein PZB75_09885 [Streptomyces sp. AM 4-1-1]